MIPDIEAVDRNRVVDFVRPGSVVRRIWGNGDMVLLIFAGAAAEFALNRAVDWNLPDDEATTVAGLVIHEARAIPEVGQTFTFHGYRFQVLRRQRNQLTALKVERDADAELEGG